MKLNFLILDVSNRKVLVCFLSSLGWSTEVFSDLEPINDNDLSEVSGQAYISFDNYEVTQQTSSYTGVSETINTEFMKVNFGADIETQLSIDHLELGKYPRYENGEPCPASGCDPNRTQEIASADISIKDFALGSYNRESDGSVVTDPFKLIDPFFEVAFERRPNGTKEVIGVRLGANQAGGMLSGDIAALTGNIDVSIEGFQPIFLGLGVNIKSRAYLQYGEGGDPNGNNNGSFDPIRAQYIGILDGDDVAVSVGPFTPNLTPGNCSLLIVDTCHSLSKFQSIEIGKDSDNGLVNNFFLSTQKKDISWAKDPHGNLVPTYTQDLQGETIVDHSNFQQTFQGSFFNIPSGGIILTPVEAANGLPRLPTRYTDAALGLF